MTTRDFLLRLRKRLASIVAFPGSILVNVLPKAVRVSFRERTRIIGQMDYPSAELKMRVDSVTEIGRLKSCMKEPGTAAWLDEHMGPDDVLYDIGANVGAYSLIAGTRARGGNGKVVSFEPSFRNFSRLNENIELNGLADRIIPISLALSDAEGIVGFEFSSDEIGAALHNMDGSTVRTNARSAVSTMSVLTARLADVVERYDLPRPTLIKLDVDGPEFEILVGAGALLEDPGLKTILVEVEPDPAMRQRLSAHLEARGWKLHSRNNHFGNAVDEDWVWIRV
jgi:FkbM family methyltransferase